ncbi:MAG: 3-isopropylmalate dehydratase small subunit [Candidatus Sumerlaeia bacterium]
MKPFTVHTGIVAPLEALNVDTDQIMPKQFLKRIERTGYEDFAFFDWRYTADGTPNPDFEMNAPRYKGASILLSKDNFGCGSSREHAVWGLENYGFRAILAPSFADIFFNNCFNNGVLPIVLPGDVVEQLFKEVRAAAGYKLTIDLEKQRIVKPDGSAIAIHVDPVRRERMLKGLDQIGVTLINENKIAQYERAHNIA